MWVVDTTLVFYGFTSDISAFAVFKLNQIILCGGIFLILMRVFILKVGIFIVLSIDE